MSIERTDFLLKPVIPYPQNCADKPADKKRIEVMVMMIVIITIIMMKMMMLVVMMIVIVIMMMTMAMTIIWLLWSVSVSVESTYSRLTSLIMTPLLRQYLKQLQRDAMWSDPSDKPG